MLAFTPDAPYSTASVPLNPGDRLLLYTDGLIETADLRGVFFGDARLFESLRKTAGLDLPAFLAHLIGDLNAWRGPNAPLTDDVTLVAIGLRTVDPANQATTADTNPRTASGACSQVAR